MTMPQPADKSQFLLPDLGEGVAEGELIRWKVKAGEAVKELQTLAEMETDKALVEVPSPWAGVIRELHGNEGDIIKVGNVLVSFVIGAGAKVEPAAVGAVGAVADSEDAGTVVGRVDTNLTVSDRFTRRREEGNGAATTGKALATPAVRRVARELGVDINSVAGTGRGGRVTASDVYSFTSGDPGTTGVVRAPSAPRRTHTPAPVPVPAPPAAAAVDAEGVSQRIPFRGVRRKIAQALEQSVRTAVHFTVTDEADVTTLDAKRREYASVMGAKLSFLPLVMTAVCRALRLHPSLNANVDDPNEQILIKGVINMGVAVDTDAGLMVPVIRNTDKLSIADMSQAVASIAGRARDRTIPREELIGGTFTISNVGSYGGMFATPIINYPEVGILAVGRVKEQVMTRDGMFYAGRVMPLSLSCDHRVVDGAEGARFLNTIVRMLEQPDGLVG